MALDYRQFENLTRNTEKLSLRLSAWLETFLIEQALKAKSIAEELTPVDTGRLQRSWKISGVELSGDTLTVELYNETEYASFMEDGFSYQKNGRTVWREGFHMASIAIAQVEDAMPGELLEEFNHLLVNLGA